MIPAVHRLLATVAGTHRVRLQVDDGPEGFEVSHGFQHETRHIDLMQGQRDT